MTLAPISVPDRKASPNLTVNLGSNNPFRNRALSSGGPTSPRPERPRSTNPFLDETELLSPTQSAPSGKPSSPMSDSSSPPVSHAAELFENLSLDKSKPKERRPPPPHPDRPFPPSQRPKDRDGRPGSNDDDKSRQPPRPPRESRPRPRRNSESSLLEKPKLTPEEERRRREARRHHDSKHRSKRQTSYRLDVIDKLDVTSIYVFHHDGPFDACNPHRNRKPRTAPLHAFAKDSKNMAVGGSGPNNSELDLALFHGQTAEGYLDYNTGSKKPQSTEFDPMSRVEPVHGAESMGLGTSTFLEGTPASRAAIERRDSEAENMEPSGGGLQRKKSLAQRFRGINKSASARPTPPDAMTSSAARASSSNRANDKNPFMTDYDAAYDSKTAKIEEAKMSGRSRASSSPKPAGGLERRTTDERSPEENKENKPNGGGGFMTRMKSLRRPRPERRMPSE
ncbi:hypothetical protein VTN49DRAFT_2249 [Thermomyces lanuginosus]|uniref:uncharacterized protein n=1 Tax=Thermomyces lanuginosus TaxID=5541 RepID=UPI0037431CE0